METGKHTIAITPDGLLIAEIDITEKRNPVTIYLNQDEIYWLSK
jgi:hypothetical protein